MSFKQTLKLHHNNNVIKTFNHSSKLAFKLAKTSCHISFLKSCRDFSITPKGLTLSDPLKSCRSHEILQKAQSLLVTSRLQRYKRDYATTESLYLSLLQQLQVSLNNTDHYEHIAPKLRQDRYHHANLHLQTLQKISSPFRYQ